MPEKRPAAPAKTEDRERQQPSHKVYSVEGEGENAFWTRIGSAFPHKDGKGLNVVLSAMPINPRIVLRAAEPEAAEPGEEEQQEKPARKR